MIGEQVLTPPWRIVPRFYYLKKGELPSPDGDESCYCCATTYPQYHRVEVRICPDHPNWRDEADMVECLRHEVFHSFFGGINDVLTAVAPDLLANDQARSLLDNAEDEAVNRLAVMPIFKKMAVWAEGMTVLANKPRHYRDDSRDPLAEEPDGKA